jgi:hypothetical protein
MVMRMGLPSRMIVLAATLACGVVAPAVARAQAVAPEPVPPPSPTVLERWVDLQAAMFQVRYRDVETSAGTRTTNQMQDNITLRARLTFDARRRFWLGMALGTGAGFTSGWNNTGIGTGDALKTVYMKHLFLGLAPVTGVEAAYGSIGIVRGESTEITSYDNDGYLLGGRVSVKRPKDFWFDARSTSTMPTTGTCCSRSGCGRGSACRATTPGSAMRCARLAQSVPRSA